MDACLPLWLLGLGLGLGLGFGAAAAFDIVVFRRHRSAAADRWRREVDEWRGRYETANQLLDAARRVVRPSAADPRTHVAGTVDGGAAYAPPADRLSRPMSGGPRADLMAALKPGDLIEYEFSDGWKTVEVQPPGGNSYSTHVTVRRPGRTKAGAKYPEFRVFANRSDWRPEAEVGIDLRTGVYCDWLIEHGFDAAADALRAKFNPSAGDES